MDKNKFKEYDVNIARLSNKKHFFEFDLKKKFFESFEQDFIKSGNIHVSVTIDKTELLTTITINYDGSASLICDRSLDEFEYPLAFDRKIFIKFGDHHEELDDNLVQLNQNEDTLNLAQFIFEYLVLGLPSKRLHPRYSEEEDEEDSEENEYLIFTSEEEEGEEDNNENKHDPRWDALNKLKDKLE